MVRRDFPEGTDEHPLGNVAVKRFASPQIFSDAVPHSYTPSAHSRPRIPLVRKVEQRAGLFADVFAQRQDVSSECEGNRRKAHQ
jgi:hypothetical protein